MSNEANSKVLKIIGSQLQQYRGIDRIVAKRLLVLLQPEIVEPRRDIHRRLPDASPTLTEFKWYANAQRGSSPGRVTRCMTRRQPW